MGKQARHTRRSFIFLWVKTAILRDWKVGQVVWAIVGLILALVGWLVSQRPKWEAVVGDLTWQVPLAAFAILGAGRAILAPYWIIREMEGKNDNLRQEISTLNNDLEHANEKARGPTDEDLKVEWRRAELGPCRMNGFRYTIARLHSVTVTAPPLIPLNLRVSVKWSTDRGVFDGEPGDSDSANTITVEAGKAEDIPRLTFIIPKHRYDQIGGEDLLPNADVQLCARDTYSGAERIWKLGQAHEREVEREVNLHAVGLRLRPPDLLYHHDERNLIVKTSPWHISNPTGRDISLTFDLFVPEESLPGAWLTCEADNDPLDLEDGKSLTATLKFRTARERLTRGIDMSRQYLRGYIQVTDLHSGRRSKVGVAINTTKVAGSADE